MPHAALDVVHKPAFAVDRDNRNAAASDETAVLENLVPAEDVLMHPLALYPLLSDLN